MTSPGVEDSTTEGISTTAPFQEFEHRQEGKLHRKKAGRYFRSAWVAEWFTVSAEFLVSFASQSSWHVESCIALASVVAVDPCATQQDPCLFRVRYCCQTGGAKSSDSTVREVVLRAEERGGVQKWLSAIAEGSRRCLGSRLFVPLACARERVAHVERQCVDLEAKLHESMSHADRVSADAATVRSELVDATERARKADQDRTRANVRISHLACTILEAKRLASRKALLTSAWIKLSMHDMRPQSKPLSGQQVHPGCVEGTRQSGFTSADASSIAGSTSISQGLQSWVSKFACASCLKHAFAIWKLQAAQGITHRRSSEFAMACLGKKCSELLHRNIASCFRQLAHRAEQPRGVQAMTTVTDGVHRLDRVCLVLRARRVSVCLSWWKARTLETHGRRDDSQLPHPKAGSRAPPADEDPFTKTSPNAEDVALSLCPTTRTSSNKGAAIGLDSSDSESGEDPPSDNGFAKRPQPIVVDDDESDSSGFESSLVSPTSSNASPTSSHEPPGEHCSTGFKQNLCVDSAGEEQIPPHVASYQQSSHSLKHAAAARPSQLEASDVSTSSTSTEAGIVTIVQKQHGRRAPDSDKDDVGATFGSVCSPCPRSAECSTENVTQDQKRDDGSFAAPRAVSVARDVAVTSAFVEECPSPAILPKSAPSHSTPNTKPIVYCIHTPACSLSPSPINPDLSESRQHLPDTSLGNFLFPQESPDTSTRADDTWPSSPSRVSQSQGDCGSVDMVGVEHLDSTLHAVKRPDHNANSVTRHSSAAVEVNSNAHQSQEAAKEHHPDVVSSAPQSEGRTTHVDCGVGCELVGRLSLNSSVDRATNCGMWQSAGQQSSHGESEGTCDEKELGGSERCNKLRAASYGQLDDVDALQLGGADSAVMSDSQGPSVREEGMMNAEQHQEERTNQTVEEEPDVTQQHSACEDSDSDSEDARIAARSHEVSDGVGDMYSSDAEPPEHRWWQALADSQAEGGLFGTGRAVDLASSSASGGGRSPARQARSPDDPVSSEEGEWSDANASHSSRSSVCVSPSVSSPRSSRSASSVARKAAAVSVTGDRGTGGVHAVKRPMAPPPQIPPPSGYPPAARTGTLPRPSPASAPPLAPSLGVKETGGPVVMQAASDHTQQPIQPPKTLAPIPSLQVPVLRTPIGGASEGEGSNADTSSARCSLSAFSGSVNGARLRSSPLPSLPPPPVA